MSEGLELTGQKKEQDAEKWAEVMHPVPRDQGRNFSLSGIAKAGGDESHEKSIRSFIVRNSLYEVFPAEELLARK